MRFQDLQGFICAYKFCYLNYANTDQHNAFSGTTAIILVWFSPVTHSKTAYTGIHFLQLCMKSAVFTGYINTYLSQQKNHILVNKTSVSTRC